MKSLKQIRKIKSEKKQKEALDERAKDIMRKCDWEYLSKIEWASIRSQDEWRKAKKAALKDYFTGKFLIESLGGVRHNRPFLMAILLQLRLAWIEEYALTTVPEFLLLDFALISYFRFLRTNSIIGNLEWIAEAEFFGRENPKIYNKNYYEGFIAEKHIDRMTQLLQPNLEKFNRMFLRNLKAIRDLKRSNAILNIEGVTQINIGEKQVNIGKGK